MTLHNRATDQASCRIRLDKLNWHGVQAFDLDTNDLTPCVAQLFISHVFNPLNTRRRIANEWKRYPLLKPEKQGEREDDKGRLSKPAVNNLESCAGVELALH